MSSYKELYDSHRKSTLKRIEDVFKSEGVQESIRKAIMECAEDEGRGYLVSDYRVVNNTLWAQEFTRMIKYEGGPFYFSTINSKKGLYIHYEVLLIVH